MQDAGELDDKGFRRSIDRYPWNPVVGKARGYIDNGTASVPQHAGQGSVGQQCYSRDIHRDHFLDVCGIHLQKRLDTPDSGIVDQHRQALFPGDAFLHPPQALRIGEIRDQDLGRYSTGLGRGFGQRLQSISPPGDKKQIIAACSQGFSVCTADSRRTAGDQRERSLCNHCSLPGEGSSRFHFRLGRSAPLLFVISCILTITHIPDNHYFQTRQILDIH